MRNELTPELALEIATAYSVLYCPPTTDQGRRSLRTMPSPEVEARLAEQCGAERVEQSRAAGAEVAEHFAHLLLSYARHFAGIGIGKRQVRAYLQSERRVLTEIYNEGRSPVISPDKVRRLVLQYALDARYPVSGLLRRFDVRFGEGSCEIGERPAEPLLLTAIPPHEFKVVRHPFAAWLMRAAYADRPAAHDIVQVVESIFGRSPASPAESPVAPATPAVENKPTTSGKTKKPRITYDEANLRVRDYIKSKKLEVGDPFPTVREIHRATKVSIGYIGKLSAYRAGQRYVSQGGTTQPSFPTPSRGLLQSLIAQNVDVKDQKAVLEQIEVMFLAGLTDQEEQQFHEKALDDQTELLRLWVEDNSNFKARH